jgi:hypothetical protein
MLKYGQQYVDKGAAYYEQRNRHQQIHLHIACGAPPGSIGFHNIGISSHRAAALVRGVVRKTRDQAEGGAVWAEFGLFDLNDRRKSGQQELSMPVRSIPGPSVNEVVASQDLSKSSIARRITPARLIFVGVSAARNLVKKSSQEGTIRLQPMLLVFQ